MASRRRRYADGLRASAALFDTGHVNGAVPATDTDTDTSAVASRPRRFEAVRLEIPLHGHHRVDAVVLLAGLEVSQNDLHITNGSNKQ